MTTAKDGPCNAILSGISAYLDGDLDSHTCDAIERHCVTCARCAEVVKGLRETIGLCRDAAAVPLPEHVRRRARQQVRELLDKEST